MCRVYACGGMQHAVATHEFERVEEIDGSYVLVCACGWRSPADPSAAVVGTSWDEHLAEAA